MKLKLKLKFRMEIEIVSNIKYWMYEAHTTYIHKYAVMTHTHTHTHSLQKCHQLIENILTRNWTYANQKAHQSRQSRKVFGLSVLGYVVIRKERSKTSLWHWIQNHNKRIGLFLFVYLSSLWNNVQFNENNWMKLL